MKNLNPFKPVKIKIRKQRRRRRRRRERKREREKIERKKKKRNEEGKHGDAREDLRGSDCSNCSYAWNNEQGKRSRNYNKHVERNDWTLNIITVGLSGK